MKYFVTGGAGFIGSHLADRLIKTGEVTVYDSLWLGKVDNIKHLMKNGKFRFVNADLLDKDKLVKEMAGHDIVFHLAANSDISYGTKHTDTDLKIGTIATFNVLDAMRINGIKKVVFSPSSAIYGEAKVNPTPEDYAPLFPISLYGASKLACEGLVSAFSHNFGMQAWIFRFANIIGARTTHGVVHDFVKKLKENPKELEILGDGRQSKPYMEVSRCVDCVLFGQKNSKEQLNYFNVSTDGTTSVSRIAEIIIEEMGLKGVKIRYTGGSRGWKGDIPFVSMDTKKMEALGWKCDLDSDGCMREAIRSILKHGQ